MTATTAPTGIAKYIPILGWLPNYQSGWLRFDLVAGLTAAAVVIPQSMAYATIAGLPIQVGLYVALVNTIKPQVLVLDCDAIPDIEYTALMSLTEFEEQLSEAGVSLWLAALNDTPLHVVERAPLGATLGHERIFLNLEQAVEAIQNQRLTEEIPEVGGSEAT